MNCPKRITTYFLTLLMSLLEHAVLGTSKPTIPKIHIDIINLRFIKCIACEQCPSESHPRCSSDTSSGKRRHGASWRHASLPRLIPPVLRGFLCQLGLSPISSAGESACYLEKMPFGLHLGFISDEHPILIPLLTVGASFLRKFGAANIDSSYMWIQ